MARAAVVWREGEALRWAELADDRPNLVGRRAANDVAVGEHHTSVSRVHASITRRDGRFAVEHQSQTNSTRVNGRPVDRVASLSDKDTIELGTLTLVFHDLAAGDLTSGWICSACRHENKATDTACWFDGLSRAYADSTIRVWHPVLCRVLVVSGGSRDVLDVYEGESLAIVRNGARRLGRGEVLPTDAVAAVELREGHPELRVLAVDAPVTLNGQTPASSQPLNTGDVLSTGGSRLLALVRLTPPAAAFVDGSPGAPLRARSSPGPPASGKA